VELLTTFVLGKFFQSIIVPYLLVDANTSYNVLLRRPTLNVLGAIVFTPHLTMKFTLSHGEIATIKANQQNACESYVKSCKIEPYIMVNKENYKALTTSVNTVSTEWKDLDLRANSEDRRPTPIEKFEPFQIRKESHQCTKISEKMEEGSGTSALKKC